MIAIAGAKGGCGKTTVTLGLAEAFAGRGTAALVVDADRQLPELHVRAGVDREPTLAALGERTDVSEVARPHPDVSGVGVVTAPWSAQIVDVESALAALDGGPNRILVDCPSGAGPDAVDPMAAADGVLVVTTGTPQSIRAAETTITMARRLGVNVLGVVANGCDSVPEDLPKRTDVPVLGTIPEVDAPLASGAVREAFADLVAELRRAERERLSPGEGFDNRLHTGIDPLDRETGGGLPQGSVAALTATPDSQSELLLHRLTTTRGTLYLSTERSPSVVRDAMDTSVADAGNATVRRLDRDDPLADAERYVEALPDKANLVVDTIGDLEAADPESYEAFLNALLERMRATGGLAVLHCLKSESAPGNRSSTKHFSDVVLDLETTVRDGTVGQRLTIPKSRRDAAPDRSIEIDLSADLGVGQPRS